MPSYGGESASLEFILRSACPDEITRMKSGRGGGGEGGGGSGEVGRGGGRVGEGRGVDGERGRGEGREKGGGLYKKWA